MDKGALTGLIVADFTAFAAGPLATKFLADHGAEVIKIESTARPDVVRAFMPFADGQLTRPLDLNLTLPADTSNLKITIDPVDGDTSFDWIYISDIKIS